ncbi:MAG: protein kinase [Terriglobia bacterium]|jgi:serine/threonine protein kinase
MKEYLPQAEKFLGLSIPLFPTFRIIEKRASGANAHVFRAHSADNETDLACKVIPTENISGDNWRDELKKPNRLRSPGIVHCIEAAPWRDDSLGIDCFLICSEYVPGHSLKEYLSAHRRGLQVVFAERFLKFIFPILDELRKLRYSHGDLHTGNVLVEDRSDILGSDPYAFRLTDFTCSQLSSGAMTKDDYSQLALILRELLENIDYQSSSARDRFVFDQLNDLFLGRYFLDCDRTREPLARNAAALFNKLLLLDTEWTSLQASAREQLTSPFDYLSCELVRTDDLLKSLYSDRFLGLPNIEEKNNLVLTGPRGCGKSTVYRSLSLRHRCLTGDDVPDAVRYIGIYYRCEDLYFAFPRYCLPSREEGLNVPLHFLTVTLLALLLESVEMWGKRRFEEEFEQLEAHTSKVLWAALGFQLPQIPGVHSFKALSDKLRKERTRAAEKQKYMRTHSSMGEYLGPEVLVNCCSIISSSFPTLQARPVYFFIDDYSSPKVSVDLQRNLNRLLMQRSAACFFKISTESPVSFERGDSDGKNFVEGREYRLVNLFSVFIHTAIQQRQGFIDDVFDRRLQLVFDYPVKSIQSLVGDSAASSHNEVARGIRKKEYPALYGRQVLHELCSGDLHYVIDLVGRMVALNGGPASLRHESSPRIRPSVQSQAIREYCGDFLRSLSDVPNGAHMIEIITAFANVAHSYLRYKNSANEAGNPPHQASRIEPYVRLDLSNDAERIYKELLRYSVFIEDVRGKSIRGHVVQRLYLRRLLIPHFNLTFSNRDSISLENSEIELLLLAPDKFYRRMRMTAFNGPDDQLPLLEEPEA